MNQSIKNYWKQFCKEKSISSQTPYESWYFCNDEKSAKDLADLVVRGIKTATCSLKLAFDYDKEPLPKLATYNVITDFFQAPICVIQTTKVELIPFNQVSAQHAFKEGEGDRSYEYWKKVHIEFFSKWLNEIGKPFDENMLLVFEEFKLLYV